MVVRNNTTIRIASIVRLKQYTRAYGIKCYGGALDIFIKIFPTFSSCRKS